MQKEIKLSELKTLLISAKNELNSMLSLNRTKKIKYEEQQYFELITFLSLWNAAGENGSNVMNIIDDVPSGDALMQQLQKLGIKEVEEQFNAIFEKQFFKHIGKRRRKAIVIIDVHEQETYSKEKKTSDHIRGGKHKNGTNYFFKFATTQIIVKDRLLTLTVKFYPRGKHLKQIVYDLVKITKKYVKKRTKKAVNGFFKKIKDCCYDQVLERYKKEKHKPRKKRKLITFVSDKFWNYRNGFTKYFSRVAKLVFGVPIACIKYGLEYNNNHVEKYNQELDDRYKTMRHFKSHVFAEAFFGMKQIIHNFVNPNIELNGKTPSQAAEIKLKLGRNKLLSLIRITAKKYR